MPRRGAKKSSKRTGGARKSTKRAGARKAGGARKGGARKGGARKSGARKTGARKAVARKRTGARKATSTRAAGRKTTARGGARKSAPRAVRTVPQHSPAPGAGAMGGPGHEREDMNSGSSEEFFAGVEERDTIDIGGDDDDLDK